MFEMSTVGTNTSILTISQLPHQSATAPSLASLPSLGTDNFPSLTFRLWYSHICAEKGR